MNTELVNKVLNIWEQAKQDSPLAQKSAVSISTIDAEGFPQSRFVDLKAVDRSGFTFCTSYASEKGKHLSANPKLALLAWWDHINYQIRVVGNATPISEELADQYWQTRSKQAQIATTSFKQSEVWLEESSLTAHFEAKYSTADDVVSRPASWGGYTIEAKSVEILQFKSNRVHHREYYSHQDGAWQRTLLQP